MEPEQLVNLADYEAAARTVLDAGVLGYYAGGAADERTLADNRAAFARRRLRPRVLVDVSEVSTETAVLGAPVAMPVLVAPTALHALAHADAEPGTARAAAAAGTVYCLSSLATTRPSDVAAAAPGGRRWFQCYVFRDRAITSALLDEALDSGFEAIVLTVDAPRAGRRERDHRTGFSVPADVDMPAVRAAVGGPTCPTPEEFFSLVDRTLDWSVVGELARRGAPVVVKGVQTAEDAALACEHGAAAIVVSNHGGRQLDGVAAAIDILPEVVEAVGGRLEVYVDGGVRRGTDVAVALALGARAVLVGRPVLWGLTVAGEAGVRRVLALLRDELELAMTLLGARTVDAVSRAHVS
ncbi:MAG TPA: alpha-hydroxy acid oxidase [Solirubrobacteraceae bacterium]|jgi:isopentenyl diphosphate isomerase/L-lactate dehydrogenase-like FMN-dependent dehydrogenase|nr:alpha-hydroxy acid oxidase [Solirubrobacteraceae bacterium]